MRWIWLNVLSGIHEFVFKTPALHLFLAGNILLNAVI